MSGTDFVDEDLLRGGEPQAQHEDPVERRESEQRLRKLSRHRKSMEHQLAATEGELERLRHRREDKEREREELANILVQQEEYERHKKDLQHKVQEALVSLENEEVRTAQLTSLYAATRKRFAEMLADINEIDETVWPEEDFHDELNSAQLTLDSVRVEVSKAVARIEAIEREESGFSGEAHSAFAPRAPAAQEAVAAPQGFGYWLKVGLAITIPLAVGLAGAALFVFWLSRNLL